MVGVPSPSFGQELGSAGEVSEMNFGTDFPVTGLVEVRGQEARPFYTLAAAQGFAPDWNFHNILLDREGRMVAQFDRFTAPEGPELVEAIEALLPGAR